MGDIVICTFYKFVHLEAYEALQQPLLKLLQEFNLRGTLLLAEEGINGTVSGTRASIGAIMDYLQSHPRLADINDQVLYHTENPFHRTKVRLKKEIVTLGTKDIDLCREAGAYVNPEDWNGVVESPGTVLIDTRNRYEVGIGTFKNAINPHTDSFREFPEFADKHLDPKKHRKVAMFCTGGIRCEKSTAYLKQKGFREVYHLKGGILNYLKKIPPESSLWEGECFVFDNRVSVGHDLSKGTYEQCHACRMPIAEEDKKSLLYEPGISCPHCHDRTPENRKKRFRERQRQIQLAQARRENHSGDTPPPPAVARKARAENKNRHRRR